MEVNKDQLHRVSEERIATLLRNAVKCGESLLNAIGQRDWVNDKDAQALRSEIGAAKALLSPERTCNRDVTPTEAPRRGHPKVIIS